MSERLSRRDFLRLTGLAGLETALTCAGCKPPKPPSEKGADLPSEPSPALEPSLTITPKPTLTVVPTKTLAPEAILTKVLTKAPTVTFTPKLETPTQKPTATIKPTSTLESTPTPKPPPWVEVDLSDQTLTYHGDEVREFIVSTGRPETPTVEGTYEIYRIFEACDMKGPGYFLKGVPHCMYFYKGYALHGTYWHDNFGHSMSHGCVNLRTEDAGWIYDNIKVGTKVWIHE